MLNTIRGTAKRIDRLDAALMEMCPMTMAPVVAAFQALRGVGFLTATILGAEAGDLRRFDHPRQLMAFLGLVPSEHSTGETRQRGGITKTVLDYVPAVFRVIRHVRPKPSCRRCESIAQAPVPSLPIHRRLATPALLAHVLVAKYADHCPLYRQSEIYARAGV